MIDLESMAVILNFGFGLILLWVLVFWCWKSYRIDSFRQKLFALRDELFDFADSGAIAFDDPAYYRLRKTLNGMIRFAHQITFPRLCIALIAEKISPDPLAKEAYQKWNDALLNINDFTIQETMLEIHSRMSFLMVKHMIKGSPTLFVSVVGVLIGTHLFEVFVQIKQRFMANLTLLESQAVEALPQ